MRGFGWGGGEEEGRGRRRRRRREGFFVCGDEKREKGKLTKGRVGRIQKCDWGGFVI